MVLVPERFSKMADLRAVFDFPTLVDRSVPFSIDGEDIHLARLLLPDVVRHEIHLIDDLPGGSSSSFRGRLLHRKHRERPFWFARDREAVLSPVLHTMAERSVELELTCYVERPFGPWLRIPLPHREGDAPQQTFVRTSDFLAHATVQLLEREGSPARAAFSSLVTRVDPSNVSRRRESLEPFNGVLAFQGEGRTSFVFQASATAFSRRIASFLPFDPGDERADPHRPSDRREEPNDPLGRRAWAEVPPRIPPGTSIDLGTIAVGRNPVLVAGIVVDERGRPVQQATVNVWARERSGARRPARTDASGLFCVTGLTPWDALVVEVDAVDYPVLVRDGVLPGTPDLHCVLVESGNVQIHLSDPPPLLVTRQALRVFLRNEEDGEAREVPIVEPEGVRIERLRPGRYATWLSLHATPLGESTTVLVRAGETTDCREFTKLDFARLVLPIEVRIVDETGAALANRKLHVSGGDSEHRGRSAIWQSGTTGEQTFLVPARWSDLELILEETEASPISLTRGLQTIRMR